ncbi:MAG: fumarylacetoacetate hydrolase family protein [Opitutaceae bacterium]|nr:fumarylacetoacetate hydrolase family protein [Opitutaceae bacterium]
MKIHRTIQGLLAETGEGFRQLPAELTLDALFSDADPAARLRAALPAARPVPPPAAPGLAPIGSQEVWAAGVTYLRSRTARMDESKASGGAIFYDKVYEAARPELFFKAPAYRVVGPGEPVRIRRDSRWNVPEPELTLAINAHGRIFGYTIGNDMSSRDIEGENPLYLPQAKVYDGAAALGPCLLVGDPLPPTTAIGLEIRRAGRTAFQGATDLGKIKRPLPSLAEYLFRETSFPRGCYLMTGTGVCPPDEFTLQSGDEILITLAPIGVLANRVA